MQLCLRDDLFQRTSPQCDLSLHMAALHQDPPPLLCSPLSVSVFSLSVWIDLTVLFKFSLQLQMSAILEPDLPDQALGYFTCLTHCLAKDGKQWRQWKMTVILRPLEQMCIKKSICMYVNVGYNVSNLWKYLPNIIMVVSEWIKYVSLCFNRFPYETILLFLTGDHEGWRMFTGLGKSSRMRLVVLSFMYRSVFGTWLQLLLLRFWPC